MQIDRLTVLVLVGLLFGCSSTTVVLVPDPSGKVGEVAVSTTGGEQILKQAGESTEVSSTSSAPSSSKILSDTEIGEMFEVALKNEPAPPRRFIFYFEFDSAHMSPEAERKIPEIYRDLKSRTICEISVIGHSDRVGDAAYNRTLSLKRADTVAKLLTGQGIPEGCMDLRYYGESDPIIPTPDGIPEPRNRRVEVEVR
jgi:outer membrane protein OmpA-like peptidoglycan-associated protein